MKIKELLTKEFLYEHYVVQRKSVHTIAKEFNIKSSNSITQYLKKYGISRSCIRDSKLILTKEFLEEYYIKQNLSLRDVAIKAGFKRKDIVKKALNRYGIPIREHTKSKKMQDFNIKKRNHHTIPSRYFYSLIHSAKIRNIDFFISIDQIWKLFEKQNKKCSISGVDLTFPKYGEKANFQTASLDRIDSEKGYTIDNVQWVHKDINTMKWHLKQEKFISWCEIITNYQEEKK